MKLAERKTRIIAMWRNGNTSGEIARELHITRSQVMGTINRAQKLGLVERRALSPSEKPKQETKPIRLPKTKPVTPLKVIEMPKEPPPEDVKPLFVPEPIPPAKTKDTKTILQLGLYDCRYILDDGKYCGLRANNAQSPWCEEHRKLVYAPGTAKKNLRIVFRF
jgi:hypothetical protein